MGSRIYKDDRLLDVVRPIIVMNLINGYWINYTGSIIVEIYYKPLEGFKRGS